MALLQISPEYVVVGLKSQIEVFVKRSDEHFTYTHECNKDSMSGEEGLDCMKFSQNFTYLAALFADKTLAVWAVAKESNEKWKKLGEKRINRRSTSLAFTSEENKIFVADKSGDLYAFSLQEDEFSKEISDKVEPVLGHISILLDVAITDKYIITADRDEKVRVSNRQHPYVIQSFCLGHTEFVCKVLTIGELLLSTSGDGTLRVWDIESGAQLQSCHVVSNIMDDSKRIVEDSNGEKVKQRPVPSLICYSPDLNIVAVACAETDNPAIDIFKLTPHKEQLLERKYSIPIQESTHLLDICFDNSYENTMLSVLIQHNQKTEILYFVCNSKTYEASADLPVQKRANLFLSTVNVDVSVERYSQLFKTTIPGHVYEAFYNKKKNHFKKEKNSAKKTKFE